MRQKSGLTRICLLRRTALSFFRRRVGGVSHVLCRAYACGVFVCAATPYTLSGVHTAVCSSMRLTMPHFTSLAPAYMRAAIEWGVLLKRHKVMEEFNFAEGGTGRGRNSEYIMLRENVGCRLLMSWSRPKLLGLVYINLLARRKLPNKYHRISRYVAFFCGGAC